MAIFPKGRKIDIFPKELTHGFGLKMVIFQLFFLGNIFQENVFYDILERKSASLAIKKQEIHKVEKLTFFQRGYPMILVQKWAYFLLFYRNIGQENVFYFVLEKKKASLSYKKRS